MEKRRFSNRNKPRRRRFYKRKGFWLTLLLLGAIGCGFGWVALDYYTKPYRERAEVYDLSKINELESPSLILDREGKELGRIFVQNRSVMEFSEIPENMLGALKSGEDRRFDSHEGVDYIGVVRAGYLNWKAGEQTQGGSTITQQLARGAFDLQEEARKREETPYERKLVEAFLAMRIEEKYEKSEILEFYLNRIYFGSGFYGLRSAALGYFGKEPKKLTDLECATLVGLIKRPNDLSPLNNPEACRRARNMVLDRMREDGRVSSKDHAEWLPKPVLLSPKPLRRGTSHVYDRISNEVSERIGEKSLEDGGYRIYTTISLAVQKAAAEALAASLQHAESRSGYVHPKHADFDRDSGEVPAYLQGALLMVDHETGEVLAHVGGRDYADAPFDFIEQGRRPAGTAFFPFIYAAGLEAGLTPASIVGDEAMDNRSVMVGGREGILGEWGMEIANPTYEGNIPARRALETSKIAATVRFGTGTGLERILTSATKFGLQFQETELLPRILVGWESVSLPELVRAYAAFARQGELGPRMLSYVDRIENSAGEVIYRRVPATAKRVRATEPGTAFQLHSMLQGAITRGTEAGATGQLLQSPFPGGGKSGTTNDFSDCWFLGYNSRISCGVWVGFLQGAGQSIYGGAFGRELAMPVWTAAMNAAAPAFGGTHLKPPPNLEQVQVCRVSGQRATRDCYRIVEDPEQETAVTVSTAISEWLRKDGTAVPFCSLHGSGEPLMAIDPSQNPGAAALRAIPIRPQAPALIGEDPYNSLAVTMMGDSGSGGASTPFPRRTISLESLNLGDKESEVKLGHPRRLEIVPD